ncbi:MAG: hypothetical protein PHN21_07470, partial [Erysipelotrichaceae bacterium]|nr:hypothetical protein [Erysipelotrichaceae bacterium]
YVIPIKKILDNSVLYGLTDESKKLLEERFKINDYYRTDPWWHNAYKIKINKGCIQEGYEQVIEREVDTRKFNNIRIRVWQKNGSCAWSSPIFIKKRGA